MLTAVMFFFLAFVCLMSAAEMVLTPVPVTFALTVKEATGAVRPRDPSTGRELKNVDLESSTHFTITKADGSTTESMIWGLKSVVGKFGNKELIAKAVEDGLIQGPITGWSISALPTMSLSENDWTLSYEVRFVKNLEAVPWFTFSVTKSEIASSGEYTVIKNKNGVTIGGTFKGTQTHEKPVSFVIPDSEDPEGVHVTGLFSCTAALKSYYVNPANKESLTSINVPGKAQITNILVAGDDYDYVTGSITFGAASAK